VCIDNNTIYACVRWTIEKSRRDGFTSAVETSDQRPQEPSALFISAIERWDAVAQTQAALGLRPIGALKWR
jgi:hypothetical protein